VFGSVAFGSGLGLRLGSEGGLGFGFAAGVLAPSISSDIAMLVTVSPKVPAIEDLQKPVIAATTHRHTKKLPKHPKRTVFFVILFLFIIF
jgi:hypothetical protein